MSKRLSNIIGKPLIREDLPPKYGSYNIGQEWIYKNNNTKYILFYNDNNTLTWISDTKPQLVISAKQPFIDTLDENAIWNGSLIKIDNNWITFVIDTKPDATLDITKGYKVGSKIECNIDKNIYYCYSNKEDEAIWARIFDREPTVDDTKESLTLTDYVYFNNTLYENVDNLGWLNKTTNTLKVSDVPEVLDTKYSGIKIVDIDDLKQYVVGTKGYVLAINTDRDPTKTDDIDYGYNVGFRWFNIKDNREWILYSAVNDNAIWAIVKPTYPTIFDDESRGFNVDDFWYDDSTGTFYKCQMNTFNAAKWTSVEDEKLEYSNIKIIEAEPTSTDDITKGYYARDIVEVQITKELWKAFTTAENAAIWAKMEGRDPTNIDDANDGWNIDQYWYSAATDTFFKCKDNTIGNAVWEAQTIEAVSNPNMLNTYYVDSNTTIPRNCKVVCKTDIDRDLSIDEYAYILNLTSTYYNDDVIKIFDADNNAEYKPIKLHSDGLFDGEDDYILDVNGFEVTLIYKNNEFIVAGE